jgi:TP901 family phage tail tape measure protein
MAEDTNANIRVDIDTTAALASIKNLQRQISAFHTNMAKGGAAAAATSLNLQQGLLNSINRTGQFSATIKNVKSTTESFTSALEKNKLSMREYFRYSGAATKTFGRLFTSEFDTINKVARERVKDLQTQYIKMGRDANGAIRSIAVRPLALDMESLSTKTQIAAQKQALLNQMLKQGSTNLLNFGKNTQWAGRQLMVGFTIPLTMFGTVAAKTFMDMEKQAIRFKRVYGEMFTTTAETNKALEEIKNLASEFTKYGVAVEKTMSLAADVAATGKMGAELTAQVANATRLAVLGGVEQAEALQATISLTDAFGTSAEDLAGKINFLNAVENQTITSIEDLTTAIPKAGPVVQQLGGNVEDLTFFLTAMREGGINASEGANALKSGLASLINPTGTAAEMLQGFGINLKGIVDANRGNVKGIVIDFAKALDTLDPLNRAQAIEQLFGKFQFARLSTLFQNVIKEGNQASRVLKLTNATTEELAVLAERELKKVEDSPLFKFQKAVEDIKVTLVPLGEAFLKAVTPVLEFGTKVLEKFNELDEGAKGFVVGLTAIAGVIGPVFLMGFGLIANGVANIIKMFTFFKTALNKAGTASTELGMQTDYMTQQQLEASAVAASLNQVHQRLTQTFSSEAAAINNLTVAYRKALAAQNGMTGGAISRTRPPKKYASGVVSVPGPKGAGDIVPAMLAPGEAIIPAKQAKKYAPFIQDMISGNIPGFRNGVFLGMPKSAKSVTKSRTAADEIYEMFKKSSFVNTPPTAYGHQISPTSGHSFPIFGLGGVYQKGNKQVFVKPVMDEKAALAEIRATTIARQAHGLKSPDQRIVVIRDPMDVKRQRKFLALESDLDPTFVNNQPLGVFNEEQYFKQLTASLLRGDKDLSASNVYGDVLADVGPAGVFDRASGLRDYSRKMPSMEEQALVNLLGVKGGAKRAFAESTLSLMGGLTPQQYHQKMIGEIQRVLPKLKQTIASFKLTNPTDVGMYDDMVRRLEAGLNVDWSKFHSVHSAVKIPKPKAPKVEGYKKGVVSVPGPKGAGDVMPAMLSPGEAVIPTKMAKKYAPLIQGMVADSIPGFATSNVGKNFGHIGPGDQLPVSDVLTDPNVYPTPGVRKRLQTLANVDDSALVNLKHSFGRSISENTNNLLGKPSGAPISQVAGDFSGTNVKDAYDEMFKLVGEKNPSPQLIEEFTNYDNAMSQKMKDLKETGIESIVDFEEQWKQLPEIKQKTTRSLEKIDQEVAQQLEKNNPNFAKTRRNAISTIRDIRIEEGLTPKQKADLLADPVTNRSLVRKRSTNDPTLRVGASSQRFGRGGFGVRPGYPVPELAGEDTQGELRKKDKSRAAAEAEAVKRGKSTAAAMVKGQKSVLEQEQNDPVNIQRSPKRGSPHPQASIDGRDDARARIAAQRKEFAALSKEEKYVRNLQSNYGGAQVVTPEMRGTRKQVENLEKRDRFMASQAKARAVQVANQQRMAAASNQALYGTTDFTPQMRQERKRQRAAEKAANAQANTERKILAREKDAAAQAQKQASLSPQTTAKAPRQRRPGMGMGGMAMVASGALMAGSMAPGAIGEISQQLMMPVMALSMILPMLTSKFAIVTAAIAGLVAAFVFVQMAIAGIRKESAELTRSMSSGKEAMTKFAEAAGTVTPSEYMEKRREQQVSPFVVETGKTTFGQSFIDSEAGAELLTGFEKQVERFGQSRAIESLQKQITTAVATGVLSPAQAQSIAQSLGQKLNDYSITAQINASIGSIVGPDGKVLEGNTIKIYTEFIQGSTSGVTGTGGILQSEDLTGGSPIWWWDTEKVAKREGEAAGIIANFYDENQQIIDAFDAENLKNIDSLFEQGKYDEALAAEEAYQIDRKNLIASYNNQILELQKDFAGVDPTKQKAILSQLVGLAREADPTVGTSADKLNMAAAVIGQNAAGKDITSASSRGRGAALTKQDMAKQEAFQQVKVQLLGEVAGGNIDTETFNGLMKMFDPTTGVGQASLSILAKISTEAGPSSLGQLENILNKLDDPTAAAEILVKVGEIKDAGQLQDTITTLEKLSTFDAKGVEPKVVLRFFGENPDKLNALQEKFTQLDDMAKAGKLNIQTLVDQKIITTGDMEAFKADEAWFNNLEPEQQVRYVQVYLSKIETVAENEIDAWYAANKDSKRTRSQVATLLADTAARQYIKDNPITDSTAKNDGENDGGGGPPPQSILDDIVKRLRDVRKNQIKVTNGWGESAKVLENLFGGGKTIDIFGGIEQDMRRLGAGEDLISLIAGMDPKDFEAQKNKLFNFDKSTGNIIGFKRGLENIGDALNSIAVGQYVSQQQRVAAEAKNQVAAFNKLRAAGYSVEEAYQAIQDTAVATAIATGKMTKRELERMLADIRNAVSALDEVKMLTPEGMQEVFDDGFSKAMEAFEAEEKRLTLEFDVKVKADKALVAAAENEIAKIQYLIDDYEADLKGIEDQEEKINKTYDDKLEALGKVQAANKQILDQERGKLSVAEAITRGDLYAAAQAAQQVRETSASGFFASQTSAIEAGRERALGQVRGAMGLTREQVQEKIKKLSDDIFYIEEKTLEPANERIRLAQVELDKRIGEITVLGRNKTQWETIKNEIDLARVNGDSYAAAMQKALDIVEKIKLAWMGINGLQAAADPTEKKDPLPAGVDLLNSPKSVSDRAASQAAFEASGMSASQYIKFVDSQAEAKATAEKKAQIAADQKSSKAAQVSSGLTASGYAQQVSRREEAKITTPKLVVTGNATTQRATAAPTTNPSGTQLRNLLRNASGGLVNYMSNGGAPRFAKPSWAKAMGTDIVPAMLTPGEFVISRPAVSKIGVKSLNSINNGEYPGGSVYNYNLSVNVSSMSDPNDIAQTVMAQIRRVESQRIRSNKF